MQDFPDTPVVGQIFNRWRWDGTKWIANPLGAGATIGLPIVVPNGGTSQVDLPIDTGKFGLTGTFLLGEGVNPVIPASTSYGTVGTKGDGHIALLGFARWGHIDLGTANGTPAIPTALNNGDALGGLFFNGYGSVGWNSNPRAMINAYATETWSDTTQGSRLALFATAVGGINTTEVASFRPSVTTITTTQLQVYAATQHYPWAEAGLYIVSSQGLAIGIDGWGNDKIKLRKSAGTPAAPGPITSFMPLTCLEWQGRLPGGFTDDPAAQLRAYGTENWASGVMGTGLEILLVPKGQVGIQSTVAITVEATTFATQSTTFAYGGNTFGKFDINGLTISTGNLILPPAKSPLTFSYSGKPAAGSRITIPLTMNMNFAANLAGTVVYAAANPTAAATFILYRTVVGSGSTEIGRVVIGTGGGVTLSGAGASCVAGDIITMIAPATQDGTLADIGISIPATRG